jgi:2-succinyl-5-enolpyruvyl-6-hydroxy-3-cyclohexene-1-carboxylate synthase
LIDDANTNTAQATALSEELARAGVRRAILSPGSRSSPLALALDREPAIELSVVLDERAAGFVALGAALASGDPVVVTCTSGSAAANLHPAVVEADLAGVPLIVLTSDRPPELRGIGAGQTIDQIHLYGGAVRWFCEAGNHAADDAGLLHFRALGCRAVAEASRGRGPVHLNLGWREPLGPEPVTGVVTARDPLALGGRDGERPLTATPFGRGPAEELIAALTEALRRAERPLLVAGREPRPEVASWAAALAGVRAMPLLAEPTSGARTRAAGDVAIAHYDLLLRDPPGGLEPDLVLRVGDMPTSKPLRGWLGRSGGPDQIVIGPPGGWNEPTRRAGALIDADPAAVIRLLAGEDRRPDSEPGEWLAGWLEADRLAADAIEAVLAEEPPLNEPALARGFAAALAADEQALIASSMPIRDFEAFAPLSGTSARVFSNRGANGIDGTIATACGLALGSGRPTWALLGDLATTYDASSLELVAAARQPLRLVVADNGGGRIFEFLPQAGAVEPGRYERLFLTPSRVDLESLAAAYGVAYRRLENPAALRETVSGVDGPVLVHARLDPSGNVALHRRLTAAVAAAVRGRF